MGTSGSEGGPGKPTSRKADRAPRSDPYTTGPRGQRVTYPQRPAEILSRYPSGSEVAAAMTAARPAIEAAIARTHRRLEHARSEQPAQ